MSVTVIAIVTRSANVCSHAAPHTHHSHLQVLVILGLKMLVLPLLMAGCARVVGLDGPHGAALTLLSLSPAAATAFVLAVQVSAWWWWWWGGGGAGNTLPPGPLMSSCHTRIRPPLR